MTLFHVHARRPALAATVACVFVSAACPAFAAAHKSKPAAQPAGPGAQQPAPGNAEEQQKAQLAEVARKSYDAGLKEFAAGRTQSAIEQLTTAVKSGVLKPSEMAKALLTRGLAYKKENKPGQAISDLTSAIWLKNGLSPAEQKSAIAERSQAYQMAGLQDTGSTPDQRVIGTPATPSSTAPAAASNVVANPAPGPNAGSAGLSAAAIAEAAGGQKSAAGTSATVTSTAVSGESTLQSVASSSVATAEQKPASGLSGFFGWGQSSEAQQPAPAAAPAPASSGSSFTQTVSNIPGNVSGFFSNMFSSGSSAPSAAPAPATAVTTASTSAPVVAAPETSSWSSETKVATHGTQQVVKAEKASYAPEPKVKAASLKGKFKIHIAALRSKAEAEALAQKLVAEHGAELGNHVPVVDEAVIGSMGTFYRVRIAGYASQDEPRGLCDKFRSSGLDCLVVTN
ncbi:SPOR domain-containing protein [Hyphomicrobium sp.]|uniref:SPOR domain-containing protein n=1 Tax=Hyphomicrobium sp. TaxID=82 RepID=UPI000FB37597|nr:SPOR domain-containing protein [Hyphomicrobium sp.]RUO97211.1 MAG: SPOR domain-containing protein [Hyphomicrobium sp.]